MEECIELIVEYAEQREQIYKEFLERLEEWISIRPNTIQGLLDLISYIDSFHKGANVANIVGAGAGIAGAGAVLLAPFTGGLSLAVGGFVASVVGATTGVAASFSDSIVARKNCNKAQKLVDKDAEATNALISSLKHYHELTEKLSDCLGSAHGKINFKSLPPIVANSQVASRYLLGIELAASAFSNGAGKFASAFSKGASKGGTQLVASVFSKGASKAGTELAASASAFGKGAGKAGARALPVISVVCIAIDVWSIVTSAKDLKEGSKSEAGKELLKVVEKLRKQRCKISKYVIEAIRIKSQDAPCEDNEKQIIAQLLKQHENEISTQRVRRSKKENETDSSDSDESDDESIIKFCLMNARSVFNKWEEITKYAVRKSTDVLAVTETWDRLKPLVTTLSGYYPFFYFPRETRRGGGVGALIKSNFEIIKIKWDFNFNTFECINFCILTVNSKATPIDMIDIYVLYRPPNSSFKSFRKEFESLIDKSPPTSKVIIMGDFNIDWKRSESNRSELSKTNKMRELLRDCHLHQHVKTETHHNGRILDWVVTRNLKPYRLSNLCVERLFNLDHYPVTFTLTEMIN